MLKSTGFYLFRFKGVGLRPFLFGYPYPRLVFIDGEEYQQEKVCYVET